MMELRKEAISLIESLPDDRLVLAVQKLREYNKTEIYQDEESA